MIREADANVTSGDDGLALPGSLVGESQLRIPKLEPDIIFSNRVPLVLRLVLPSPAFAFMRSSTSNLVGPYGRLAQKR